MCTGRDTTEGWALYLWSSALVDDNHRNRDRRESSPYQKVARRSMSSSSTANGDDCHARKTFSTLRPYGSRVGTVEERMSREVETFTCVFPPFTVGEGVNLLSRPPPPLPVPLAVRDETISPVPSRKRPRPAYFELVPSAVAFLCYQHLVYRQLDDEDSERDGSGRLCASNVPSAGKDQPSDQVDSDDDGISDSETREASDKKERRGPPRTTGKPSRRSKAEKSLDKNSEREYFSPTGVKLEVIELPVKYDTKEWLQHVEPSPDGSRAPWRCTWQTMKNGSRVPCDYSSKKHLVKRHIEATHLCIK
jgi:hypothetical protein